MMTTTKTTTTTNGMLNSVCVCVFSQHHVTVLLTFLSLQSVCQCSILLYQPLTTYWKQSNASVPTCWQCKNQYKS